LTTGRYYFCPPSTPFVGGPTNYGSRRWLDNNFINVQGLGEDLTSKQPWYNGGQPAALPRNEIIGISDCVANGESINDAITVADLKNGFNSACFVPAVPLDPTWVTASSWQSCSLQYFYAKMIEWTYTANTANVRTAFQMLLGADTTVNYFAGGGLLPDMHIALNPQCSVVVIDGTTNFQQLALQAFLGIDRPQSFGQFSTQSLWYSGSQFVIDNLNALGAPPDLPVMLAGHSYGAAVAAVTFARLKFFNSSRPLGAITYGIPKPGDFRLGNVFEGSNSLHLANDTDIVTTLGPDVLELAPVLDTIPIPILSNWTYWKRPANSTLMLGNGDLRANVGALLDYQTLLALTIDALTSTNPSPILGHVIGTYLGRILLRCPQPEWPITPALWNFLTMGGSMLLEDLTNMELEDHSNMLLEP
jgi:pimeloyl-ACP methyl ester carboxylesterase